MLQAEIIEDIRIQLEARPIDTARMHKGVAMEISHSKCCSSGPSSHTHHGLGWKFLQEISGLTFLDDTLLSFKTAPRDWSV